MRTPTSGILSINIMPVPPPANFMWLRPRKLLMAALGIAVVSIAAATVPSFASDPEYWQVTDGFNQSWEPIGINPFTLNGPVSGSAQLDGPYWDDLAYIKGIGAGYSAPLPLCEPNYGSVQSWLITGANPNMYHPGVWTQVSATNGMLSIPAELINGTAAATVSGTMSANLKFVVDQYTIMTDTMQGIPLPTPPTYLDLLLTSTSYAQVNPTSGSTTGLDGSASASSTNGDSVSVTGIGTVATQTKKKIMRVPVSAAGTATVSLFQTVAASVTNSLPYGHFGPYPGDPTSPPDYFIQDNPVTTAKANANVNSTVQFDNRDLLISASVDPTQYKLSMPGTNADGDPNFTIATRIRAADGTMQGDIGAAASINSGNVAVQYSALVSGPWSMWACDWLWNSSLKNFSEESTPDLTHVAPYIVEPITNSYVDPWVLNLDDPNATILFNDFGSDSGSGSPPYYDGISTDEPPAQTDHIFLRLTNGDNGYSAGALAPIATDGDGAVMTANYYMHLHAEHEFFRSNRNIPSQIDPSIPGDYVSHAPMDHNYYHKQLTTINSAGGSNLLTAVSPGYAASGDIVFIQWNEPSPLWKLAGQILTLAGKLPNRIAAFAATVAGVAVNSIAPTPENAAISFSDAWANTASTFPADHPKADYNQGDFHMYPVLVVGYKRSFNVDDKYTSQGFQGESVDETDTYDGVVFGRGDFHWISN